MTRLEKALQGSTERNGGMNVPELYKRALKSGYSGDKKRVSIVRFLKRDSGMGSSRKASVSRSQKKASVSRSQKKASVSRRQKKASVSRRQKKASVTRKRKTVVAPKLPRGQVKVNGEKWMNVKPKTKQARVELYETCSECFLIPEEMKYPVCTADCKYNCDGIRHAKGLAARTLNRKNVSANAKKLAKRATSKANSLGLKNCKWSTR